MDTKEGKEIGQAFGFKVIELDEELTEEEEKQLGIKLYKILIS